MSSSNRETGKPLKLLVKRPLRSPSFARKLLAELEIPKRFSPEDILYLTPNKRRARSAMFEILSLYNGSAFRTPECFTLQTYAESLVNMESRKGLVDELDRRFILLKLLRGSKSKWFKEEHLGLLSALYSELCRHHPEGWEKISSLATQEIFDPDTEKRLQEAVELLEIYEKHLKDEALLDHERVLSEAESLIKKDLHKLLILEGYFEPWESEKKLLRELVKNIAEILVIIPDDAIAEKAELFYTAQGLLAREGHSDSAPPKSNWNRYRSREDEVVAIARKICSLSLKGVRPEEIIVVFPNLGAYRSLVERVFRRYNLNPRISMKPKLDSFPSARVVLDILLTVENNFRRRDIVALLLSPCFTKIPSSVKIWLDELSKDEGVIAGESSWIQWFLKEPPHKLKKHPQGAQIISDIKRFISGFIKRLEVFKRAMTADAFSARILETLEWLGWNAPHEIKRGLKDVFLKLSRISELAQERELSPRFIRESLDTLMRRELDSGDEEEKTDAIRVMPLVESRWLETRYLFVGGLVEGEFPPYPKRDLLLPERLKKPLSIPSSEHAFTNAEFELKRLENMASEAFFLSAPALEADRPLLTSFLLVERDETPHLEDPNLYSIQEELLFNPRGKYEKKQGVIFEDADSLNMLEERFGKNYPFRVTLLETYRACPYRYYLSSVLGFQASQEPSEEPEARFLGTVVHRVLEKLMRLLPASSAMEEKFLELLTAELDNLNINPFVKLWIEDWVRSRMDWFISEEEVRIDKGWMFDPEWLEKDLTLYFEDKGYTLKGRVDRVDWRDSSARVIDYKTGKEKGFKGKLERGESLQLPLYCQMIRLSAKANVSSFALYDFNESRVEEIADPESFIRKAMQVASECVSDIRRGVFSVPEKKPEACYFCEYSEMCS